MKQLVTYCSMMLLLCSGCGTLSSRNAFTTLKTTAVTVSKSMEAYSDLVVRGQIDEQKQAQVKTAYTQYQMAFDIALTAAQFDSSKPTPTEVGSLAGQLVGLIATIMTDPNEHKPKNTNAVITITQ